METKTVLLGLALSLSVITLAVATEPKQATERCQTAIEQGQSQTDSEDLSVFSSGLQSLLGSSEICLGEDVDPEVSAKYLLLTSSAYQGKEVERLAMRRRALSILEAKSAESPLIPEALEAINTSLCHLKDYQEALEVAKQSVQERRRIFGDESRGYIEGLIFLANGYKVLADVEEETSYVSQALVYDEQAVELATRLYGRRAPITIAAKMNLVGTLKELGRRDEAESLQEEIGPYVDLAYDL